MITTRFIVGVPFAAAITFGLFVMMRGLIANEDVERVVYQEPPVITIGRQVEDSKTKTDDPLPEPKPTEDTERPDPPPVVPDDGEKTEDGTGPDYDREPVVIDDPGRDICGQPVVRIAPTYPRRALEQGIEGYAVVEFTVTVRGTIKDALVVEQMPGSVFGSAAKRAVEGWRYKPCRVNGKVQEVRLQVQLVFELDKS